MMEKNDMVEFVFQTDTNENLVRMQSNCYVPASIVRAMYDDRQDSNLCDVKLFGVPPPGVQASTLRPVEAHRLILMYASTHLRNLLPSAGLTESIVHIENVPHESVRAMVEFIYTGQMTIAADNAIDVICGVLNWAKSLAMQSLVHACREFLAGEGHVKPKKFIQSWSRKAIGQEYACLTLWHAASTFVAKHVTDMPNDDEFLRFSVVECAKLLLGKAMSDAQLLSGANSVQRCLEAIAELKNDSIKSVPFINNKIIDVASLKPGSVSIHEIEEMNKCDLLWEHAPNMMRKLATTLVDVVKAVPSVPTASAVVGCSSYNGGSSGKVWYVCGGFGTERMLLQYDVNRKFWSVLRDLPWTRQEHSMCVVGDRLLVMGGAKSYQCGTIRNHIDEFDLPTYTWKTSNSTLGWPRAGLSACSDGRYAYVLGGYENKFETNVVEKYDCTNGKVTKLGEMIYGRSFFAADVMTSSDEGKYILVAGSRVHDGTIEKFDVDKNTWSEVGEVRESRCKLAGCTSGDDFYLLGGEFRGRADACNEVEIFNVQSGKTRTTRSMLEDRKNCFATTLFDGNVICVGGGKDAAGKPLGNVEAFDKRVGVWFTGLVPNMPEGSSFSGSGFVAVQTHENYYCDV